MTTLFHFILLGSLSVSMAACGAAPPPAVEDAEVQPGELGQALGAGALTRAQAATVLKLVDDVCGDTWCEGDFNFHFRRLTCDGPAETCRLVFELIPREGVVTRRPSYLRACTTHGFTGFDSLVTTDANGFQSLDPDYYDALTECISRVESKIR